MSEHKSDRRLSILDTIVQKLNTDEKAFTQVTELLGLAKNENYEEATHEKNEVSGAQKARTYAPMSLVKAEEIIQPGHGDSVEVVVCWHERILSSQYFSGQKTIRIGSQSHNDIVLPQEFVSSHFELQRQGDVAILKTPTSAAGELIRTDGSRQSIDGPASEGFPLEPLQSRSLQLQQGEMVRLDLGDGCLSLYVRYGESAHAPLLAPLVDLSVAERAVWLTSFFILSALGISTFFRSSKNLEEVTFNERLIRRIQFRLQPEKPKSPGVRIQGPPLQKPTVNRQATPSPSPSRTNAKTRVQNRTAGPAAPTAPTKEARNQGSTDQDRSEAGLLGVLAGPGLAAQLEMANRKGRQLTELAERSEGRANNHSGLRDSKVGIRGTGTGKDHAISVQVDGPATGLSTQTLAESGMIAKKGSVKVHVDAAQAVVGDGMDREGIRRVVLNNRNSIRACYEMALQRNPDLHGKMVLEWDLNSMGHVTSARTKMSTLSNPTVAKCVLSRLRTWKFPELKPGQLGRVRYPFVFSAK